MQRSDGHAESRLQGAIEGFNASTGVGVIAGPGGVRYGFSVGSLAQGLVPAVWQRVEFSADGGRAVAIDLPAPAARIDLGRVIRGAFGALRVHWPTFLTGAAIFVGLPTAVSAWGAQTITIGRSSIGLPAYVVGTTGLLVGNYLVMGIVFRAAMNSFQGRPTTLSETVATARHAALPLIGLGIVATLGLCAGALLLVVPGVLLSVWWSVASAVLVAEDSGVIASLRRSKELTEGNRWRIFALLVVCGMQSWALSWTGTRAATALGVAWTSEGWTTAVVIIQTASNIASGIVFTVVMASLYHELRTLKDGHRSEQVAALFA